MINLIINIYLSTVIAAIIAFVLNYRRLGKYYKTKGLVTVFNEDSLMCLLMCFIPIVNIRFGLLYFNGSMYSDEEMEEYLKEDDNEY